MKSPPHPIHPPTALLLLALLCLASPWPAAAQSGGPFDLSWSAVGSGGTGSGGTFTIGSLISTGNAGHSAGGTFQLDGGWGGVISTVAVPGEGGSSIPTSFAWMPPHPNPLTTTTSIAFELPVPANARLVVFDLSGRCVRVLANTTLAPGRHRIDWDGTDANGTRLPGGVYFIAIDAHDFHRSSRVVLLH